MPTPRDDLLFLLHDVARLLRVETDRRARSSGMTRAQWVILIWLERHPGLSQKELAALLEVEPISVARLIDRLEEHGMVERRADPSDRRVWKIHLLPAAQPELRKIEQHRAEMATIISAGLEPKFIVEMEEGLLQMKESILDTVRRRTRSIPEEVT